MLYLKVPEGQFSINILILIQVDPFSLLSSFSETSLPIYPIICGCAKDFTILISR